MLSKLAQDNDWIFDAPAVEQLLRELGFGARVIADISQVARHLTQPHLRADFLEFCRSWLEDTAPQSAASYSSDWQALAVVWAFPRAIEKHRARDIPWEITQATLLDFQRRFEEYSARRGRWEFHAPAWMRNHILSDFFEIGRLQYVPGQFSYIFRVYRDRETGAVVPLALPDLRCTSDGWPQDEASGFVTTLEERADGIYGHSARKNGSIAPTPIRIAPESPVLLDEHSDVVQIHIPWGAKLERDACISSLRAAKAFYEKHFPETPVRAFCTATWLLDPELGRVLPAHSNIAAFGRLFRLLARRNADDQQLRERVFESAEWDQCQAGNSLQKAILEHHRNGGKFRNSAGFILPTDIAAFPADPQQGE